MLDVKIADPMLTVGLDASNRLSGAFAGRI